jgi:4'-phosphopantetheinyl transferase
VQVWQTRVSPALVGSCEALLSGEERARMERIRRVVAREEFAVGRGLLRRLLGQALGCAPRSIAFSLGEHGKPGVAGVEFNVSHSHGLVAIALCGSAAVGVDVEWIAPEEVERIRLAEGGERVRAFYDTWARKEAVVKAHGGGLTVALASFCVPMQSAGEARVRFKPEVQDSYFVRPLAVGEGFAGALAVRGSGRAVTLHLLAD